MPLCTKSIVVFPFFSERFQMTSFFFHSFLSSIQWRLQSVTSQTTFFSAMISEILKSTKVSSGPPKYTENLSFSFADFPLYFLAHHCLTWFIPFMLSFAVAFTLKVRVKSFCF